VYNGATYLREAMASVINQTYTRIQIVVIDDMSTDDSWGIVNSFVDSRIVAIRNETNLGPEANFNKLLAAATGDYVKLFAQDDVLAPDCVAIQVRALEDHPSAVLAFSKRRIIGPRSEHLMNRGPHLESGVVRGSRLIESCLSNGTNVIGEPAAVLFRRSAAEVVGKFSARLPYVIDLDYWVRLLKLGDAIYCNKPLACFRVSPRQWSVAIAGRQSHDFIQFISTHSAFDEYRNKSLLMLFAKVRSHANSLLRTMFYSVFIRSSVTRARP
jgi:glycosyltransferase involved in cell wall biosynthesis